MSYSKNLMESNKVEFMADYFNSRVDGYDEIHHNKNISWGIEIRDLISKWIPKDNLNILDLGAGTGIELESIYKKYPNTKTTCIDISDKMLDILKQKFKNKNIKCYCEDFITYPFKNNYDAVISVMSIHHFVPEEKVKLFKKIYNSLKPDGIFINSDYIIDDKNEETEKLNEFLKIKETTNELIHFDIPMTLETEVSLLKQAGFSKFDVVYENKKAKILIIKK